MPTTFATRHATTSPAATFAAAIVATRHATQPTATTLATTLTTSALAAAFATTLAAATLAPAVSTPAFSWLHKMESRGSDPPTVPYPRGGCARVSPLSA